MAELIDLGARMILALDRKPNLPQKIQDALDQTVAAIPDQLTPD